mmetsp:Transcript_122801/g.393363  ORF Transcript_122801/g.393363 Transcript_122801/m.393363 type:complete len:417 (-) Transcript_122801:323-1573(-)
MGFDDSRSQRTISCQRCLRLWGRGGPLEATLPGVPALPLGLWLVVLLQVAILVVLVFATFGRAWVGQRALDRLQDQLVGLFEEVRMVEGAVHSELDIATEQGLIHDGYTLMRDLSAVFVTLIRDSRDAFEGEIPFVERTGLAFRKYTVLCVEEGSVDGTKELLRDWSARNAAVVLRESGVKGAAATAGGKIVDSRFLRMARLRNAYLDILRNEAFFGADVLIVHDSDLRLGWDVDGIAHSFGLLARARSERSTWHRPAEDGTVLQPSAPPLVRFNAGTGDAEQEQVSEDIKKVFRRRTLLPYWDYLRRRGAWWSAVCSNGLVRRDFGRHYDSIAFRNAYFTKDNFRHHEKLAHSLWGPPEVVDSCFGGLAIYNISLIGSCEYSGEDCEHVPFHRCLMEHGGRMIFNPRQVVQYSDD